MGDIFFFKFVKYFVRYKILCNNLYWNMERLVLTIPRLGKVYIFSHLNSGFLNFLSKYVWALDLYSLSKSYILYSSLLFSFSKQYIWCFLIKSCSLITKSLILLLYSKKNFYKQELKVFYCHPNLILILNLPIFLPYHYFQKDHRYG